MVEHIGSASEQVENRTPGPVEKPTSDFANRADQLKKLAKKEEAAISRDEMTAEALLAEVRGEKTPAENKPVLAVANNVKNLPKELDKIEDEMRSRGMNPDLFAENQFA